MKQYVMDLCFVLLLICMIGLFFDDYHVSKTLFQRSIDDFEQQVETGQHIQSQITLQDTSDNHVSLFLKTISDYCIQIIQFIVVIFSNFISMILTVMVYY